MKNFGTVTSNLRVCIVSAYPPTVDRGAISTSWFARALASAGVVVSVITETAPGFPIESSSDGIHVFRPWNTSSPLSLPALLFHGELRRCRIVHVIFGYAFFGSLVSSIARVSILLLVCKLSRKPCVLSIHQVFDPRKLSVDKLRQFGVNMPLFLVKIGVWGSTMILGKMSTRVIALHREDAAKLRHIFRANNVETIPMGVETISWSKLEARQSLGLASRHVLLTFGFLTPYKGFEFALQAMPRILRQIPDTILIVAGSRLPRLAQLNSSEEYATKLQSIARALRIEGNVLFDLRFVNPSKAARYFQASDALLLPYTAQTGPSEVMSLGFAYGIPLVAFETDYLKKDIVGQTTGVIVKKCDAEGLADAVVEIITNTQAYDKIRRNLDEIKSEYHVDIQVKKSIELYRNILHLN